MTNLKRKRLRITIALTEGTFEGGNAVVLEGFRTSAVITWDNMAPTAVVQIYGVSMDIANTITSRPWFKSGQRPKNFIKIEAGEEGDECNLVYTGEITFAFPDFSAAPDVRVCIQSCMSAFNRTAITPSTSYKGETDVSVILKYLAAQMSMTLELNDVSGVYLNDPHLSGSVHQMLEQVCKAAQLNYWLDKGNVLAVSKKGSPRKVRVPIITPTTGMLGYPSPDGNGGITVRTLYDKNIISGGMIRIADSAVTDCNGDWNIYQMTQYLDAETPESRWFCDIKAMITGVGIAGRINK